ncbi:MAG: alpha/beta fold hydrolase [Bacteroidetes bacterium]|nr:alpha/beta fold hydrolase [Bacteroidota bacterium]
MKKFLRWVGIILLIVFVLLNALCAWQAYIFTHFSDKKIKKEQEKGFIAKKLEKIIGEEHPRQLVVDSFSVPHQSVIIHSDSLKLAAWYAIHDADSSNGTVVMFHGFGSSRSDIIPEATAFYKMGYNVLLTDFRAHGNSDGDVCSMGYFESHDVRAAYNFIKNTGEKNIILWGGSMGAASITKAMHDDDSIQPSKVILEKCFGKVTDAAGSMARNNMHEPAGIFGALLTFWGSVEQGIFMFSMKPDKFVKSITCPVLVQWGDKDENVSSAETEHIFKNLSSHNKKLVVYPNCGHENLYLKNPSLWKTSVGNFLNASSKN